MTNPHLKKTQKRLTRVYQALGGAVAGMLPGALAWSLYGILTLIHHGELAALKYDIYVIPLMIGQGVVLGFGVGLRIGWWFGALGTRRLQRTAWIWAVNGAITGFLMSGVWTGFLWLTCRGEYYTSYLIELIIVTTGISPAIAIVVGFMLKAAGCYRPVDQALGVEKTNGNCKFG